MVETYLNFDRTRLLSILSRSNSNDLYSRRLTVPVSRKFIKASPISALLMRIIEDVYRGDLVGYFRVYVRVVTKASMKFDTRYIAKSHLFALFDCLLSSIF